MKNKILIIEDDYAIIRGLKDHFLAKGYEVYTAMDGEEAIEMAFKTPVDIILLDIMLPKVNGFEVCARIRESENETPIIMLTALGEEEDVIRGLNLGADDYVTKPFSSAQLHARCEAFIRRSRKNEVNEYQFGQYRLDAVSRELRNQNNEEIALTPKEYRMLEFFLQKEGHALTRETLLNAVWNSSVLTTARSVDRCINTLRKKIEKDTRRPEHILSVRDVGYRFSSGDVD